MDGGVCVQCVQWVRYVLGVCCVCCSSVVCLVEDGGFTGVGGRVLEPWSPGDGGRRSRHNHVDEGPSAQRVVTVEQTLRMECLQGSKASPGQGPSGIGAPLWNRDTAEG